MNKTRKNNFVYRVFLNPGFVFVVMFLATGILIFVHESRDKVVVEKIISKKAEGSNHYLDIKFKDVTLESGIDFLHSQGGKMLNAISEVVGAGACMADYDNDGFLDIYAVNGAGYTHYYGKKWWYKKPYNTLYHNNGDGTFTDVTETAGVGDDGWGMGCAFGDYDNDGNPDLYVTNYGANVLYQNNGDGTFTDVTEKAGVGDEGWGTSLSWGDYDNDGNLDIYIANYIVFDKTMNPGEPNRAFKISMPLLMDSKLYEGQRNVLYRNNGDGTFMDVTDMAGVGNSPGKSMSAVFCDFNNDNNQDIYIVNDKSRNVLYVNNGNGTFTDLGGALGIDSPLSGMGVAIGDYDNDGDMDIFSTYTQKDTNMLYKNTISDGPRSVKANSNWKFVNATVDAGLGEDVSVGHFGWGTGAFDYDNDGFLDLFVANGHGMPDFDDPRSTIGQRNQLFRNNGDSLFLEVSDSAGYGLKPMNSSRGVAMGDYDNDGDVDVFVVNNNSYAVLLQNEGGNTNNWLNIKLTGTRSNRDAIGARVKVTAGPLRITKDVISGPGYLSQSDIRLVFGLGGNTKVDTAEIRWPGGVVETFKDINANQFVAIVEGEKKYSIVNVPKKTADAHSPGVESRRGETAGVVNSELRRQVLTVLGNIGDQRALKPLLICLRDEDAGTRKEAVKALGNFDSDRTIGPIIIALEDGDVGVRREAAATLGILLKVEQTIRKSSVLRKRLAVAPLLRVLKDEDCVIRQEAVKALGFSESYRACVPVARVLDDTVKEVRMDAALTLGLLRDKRAVKPLINVLEDNDEDAYVRARALISLNRLGSEIAIGTIIDALKDDDEQVRHNAVSVFVALLESKEGVVFRKDLAFGPLAVAINDNNPMVRREAVKALGLLKDRRANWYLINALGDNDDSVKLMAIKAISSVGLKDALPYIEKAIQDKNYEVRKEATKALCVLNGSRSIPYLVNMVKDGNVEVRKQAIISLGDFRDNKTVDVLLGVVKNKNEDVYVRSIALSSLGKTNVDVGIIIDMLDDSNYEIRKEASKCLGVLKNNRAIVPLISKLTDAKKEVRREVVMALGNLKNNKSFGALASVLMDKGEDIFVRSGAVVSISRSGNRKALSYLLKALNNKEDGIRPEVVKALGDFNDESAFKRLMMIVKDRQEGPSVRSMAVMAMGRMECEEVVEALIDIIRIGVGR